MKLCRFQRPSSGNSAPEIAIGWVTEDHQHVIDLGAAGVSSLTELLADEGRRAALRSSGQANAWPRYELGKVTLLPPVERQEVWAAGVTYLRSKSARMEESDFSASAYDRVYDAARPEIFFKSLPEKVSGPGGPAGIRADARWNVPEPELALVLDRTGRVVGYTIGNDMSSRDIEGENLLYLPQAKTYRYSCVLGPVITTDVSEEEVRTWTIGIEIERAGQSVFRGETPVAKIKRTFTELAGWLFRSQDFSQGAVLLTGTGVVPPNEFTLAPGDVIRIRISGIGELVNTVAVV